MEKPYKVIAAFFIVAILAVSGLYCLYLAKSNSIILFYGDTCHYCKEVDEFVKNNSQLTGKIIFKEIENNKANADKLAEIAVYCGLNGNISAPFVYYKEKCYSGKDRALEILNKVVEEIK